MQHMETERLVCLNAALKAYAGVQESFSATMRVRASHKLRD